MLQSLSRRLFKAAAQKYWTDSRDRRASTRASIEIGAAHEVVTTRASHLAFLVPKFVTAARTPPPVFSLDLAGNGILRQSRSSRRPNIVFLLSGHSEKLQEKGKGANP